jgi:predicted RNA binding protein YcfA (HicA-like mRNA interferase family)
MPISGKDMQKKFEKVGWQKIRQKGSHVIMAKGEYRETIPMHKELGKGLEKYLFKRLVE